MEMWGYKYIHIKYSHIDSTNRVCTYYENDFGKFPYHAVAQTHTYWFLNIFGFLIFNFRSRFRFGFRLHIECIMMIWLIAIEVKNETSFRQSRSFCMHIGKKEVFICRFAYKLNTVRLLLRFGRLLGSVDWTGLRNFAVVESWFSNPSNFNLHWKLNHLWSAKITWELCFSIKIVCCCFPIEKQRRKHQNQCLLTYIIRHIGR